MTIPDTPQTSNELTGSTDDHLTEHRVASSQVFSGNFLQIRRDNVRLPDGQHAGREYIVHPGAVMVIALLDTGEVVLERQYRYPVGKIMVEFPAGKRDVGEPSLACAQRELEEETGYTAQEWALAGHLHPAIAYSTESIDMWFARGLNLGNRQLDAGEFLDVFTATPADLLAWCASGKVTDGKTLAGSLWLQNLLSGAWQVQWRAG